ncbi:MAG: hypothetical protein MZV65_10115 [Chromatiales bacterium]|nr:hypothetical protein [Chromatiales bacterium]
MDKTETAQPDSSIQTATTTGTDGATDSTQATSGSERSTNAGEVLQRYLKAQATQISRIVASLNQYRQDVQNLEVSLIARIGDVDDDRRYAATRLQRTLQTQRDELDERLKRHGSVMAMLLLLFSLLVAGTLVFFLFKLNATQEAFETQMTELKKTLEQIDASSRSEPDPQTRAQLDRLSAALAGISKSIERLSEETTTAPLDLDLHLQPEPRPVSSQRSEPEPEPESESVPEPPPEPQSASDSPLSLSPLSPQSRSQRPNSSPNPRHWSRLQRQASRPPKASPQPNPGPIWNRHQIRLRSTSPVSSPVYGTRRWAMPSRFRPTNRRSTPCRIRWLSIRNRRRPRMLSPPPIPSRRPEVRTARNPARSQPIRSRSEIGPSRCS